MRVLLRVVGLALLALVVVPAAFLLEAHREIRQLPPSLPEQGALLAAAAAEPGPQRVSWLNTASQAGRGSPPVGHPVFLLEWADGRVFAIDTGMDRAGAEEFGALLERLMDVEPIEAFGSVAEQLGDEVDRIRGVGFTHLHSDHTGGLASICAGRGESVRVYQTPRQAELGNYTTRPGRTQIEEAGCGGFERLSGGPLYAVPGFRGLFAVEAGGHTPGSTLFATRSGGTTWVFSGDVTNFRQTLLDNEPKPRLYSLLVTPEAPAHLERLRVWLAELDARDGVQVVVSHDVEAIAASGLPRHAVVRAGR